MWFISYKWRRPGSKYDNWASEVTHLSPQQFEKDFQDGANGQEAEILIVFAYKMSSATGAINEQNC